MASAPPLPAAVSVATSFTLRLIEPFLPSLLRRSRRRFETETFTLSLVPQGISPICTRPTCLPFLRVSFRFFAPRRLGLIFTDTVLAVLSVRLPRQRSAR